MHSTEISTVIASYSGLVLLLLLLIDTVGWSRVIQTSISILKTIYWLLLFGSTEEDGADNPSGVLKVDAGRGWRSSSEVSNYVLLFVVMADYYSTSQNFNTLAATAVIGEVYRRTDLSVDLDSPDSATSKSSSTQAVLSTPPLERLAQLVTPPLGTNNCAIRPGRGIRFDTSKRTEQNLRPRNRLQRLPTPQPFHSPRPTGCYSSLRPASRRGYKRSTPRSRHLHVPGVVRFNPIVKVHCIPPRSPLCPATGLGIFLDDTESDASRKKRSRLRKILSGLRRANVLRGLPAFIEIKTSKLVVVAMGPEYRKRGT